METDSTNPYAPPAVGAAVRVRPLRWRIVPAAASFLVGLLSFGIGLAGAGAITFVLLMRLPNEVPRGPIAGCSMYLGFGASWMLAGWWYWTRRYGRGLIANAIGALIVGVLIAILGV